MGHPDSNRPGGRITLEVVRAEMERLRSQWASGRAATSAIIEDALGTDGAAALDRFDRAQLADVLLVCRGCVSISQAGRALFEVSRRKKKQTTPTGCGSTWLASDSGGKAAEC